jgi:hypothetical protein
MASWHEQYLAALELRDSREQANKTVYDACTKILVSKSASESDCSRHETCRPQCKLELKLLNSCLPCHVRSYSCPTFILHDEGAKVCVTSTIDYRECDASCFTCRFNISSSSTHYAICRARISQCYCFVSTIHVDKHVNYCEWVGSRACYVGAETARPR